MNTRSFVLGASCSAAICLGAITVFSQPADTKPAPAKPAEVVPDEMDQTKMLEEYLKTASPGEHHEALEPFAGKFTCVTKMWWGGPGTPASETEGTATREWQLGGRFLQETMSSQMRMPQADGTMKAVPFSGLGMIGYNNFRNMYEGVWGDSMGTQMLTYNGAASPDKKKFTYYGTMDEPMLKVTARYVKYVSTIIDENTHTFEVYDLHAAENYKVMEITYKRVKKGKALSPTGPTET